MGRPILIPKLTVDRGLQTQDPVTGQVLPILFLPSSMTVTTIDTKILS